MAWSPMGDIISFDRRGDDGYYDVWIMNIDGSEKQRLTFFYDPSAQEFVPSGIVGADSSWSPDDAKLIAKIRESSNDPLKNESIVIIEIRSP